jgi:hypothetical protein
VFFRSKNRCKESPFLLVHRGGAARIYIDRKVHEWFWFQTTSAHSRCSKDRLLPPKWSPSALILDKYALTVEDFADHLIYAHLWFPRRVSAREGTRSWSYRIGCEL